MSRTRNKSSRLLSLLLAFVMVLGMIPAMTLNARAAATVTMRVWPTEGRGTVEFVEINDYDNAEPGSTVKVRAIPEEGYELIGYRHHKNAGAGPSGIDRQPFNYLTPGTTEFDFVVPEGTGSRFIKGVFAPKLEEGERHILVVANSLSPDAPEKARPGETVTVKMPGTGWMRATEGSVARLDGGEMTDPVAITRTFYVGLNTEWQFTMPDTDVLVTMTAERLNSNFTLVTDPADFAEHVTAPRNLGELAGNEKLTLSADELVDGKYYNHEISFSSDAVNAEGLEKPAFSITSVAGGKKSYAASEAYPVESGTVTVKFVETTSGTITVNPVTGAEVTASYSSATPGTPVTLTLKADAATGYYYDTEADPAILPSVKDADGSDVTVTAGAKTTTQAVFTFTMPEGNVTVTPPENIVSLYPQRSITIQDTAVITAVTPENPRDGAEVTLSVSAPEGKKVAYVKATDEDGVPYYIYPDSEGAFTFPMPFGKNLTLAALTGTFWFDEGNYDENLYHNPTATVNIRTAKEFAGFFKAVNENPDFLKAAPVTVNLLADIDLSEHLWRATNAYGAPWTLNGNGYSIKGLRIETPRVGCETGMYQEYLYFSYGLFSVASVSVNNLTVEGAINASIPYNLQRIERYQDQVFIMDYQYANVGLFGAVGHYGAIDRVITDVDINVEGIYRSDFTQSNGIYVASLSNTESSLIRDWPDRSITNCAVLGDITVKNVNPGHKNIDVRGLAHTHRSFDRYSNNYVLSNIRVDSSIEPSGNVGTVMYRGISISGIFDPSRFTNADPQAANNYFAGTITASENASVGGVTDFRSNDLFGSYSVGIDPCPAELAQYMNLTRQDDARLLLASLNAWVEDNQAQENGENIYETWKMGENGLPTFGAAEGGGTVNPTSYNITAAETEHGGVALSKRTANATDDVSFTAMPDTGYIVDTVSVVGENGRRVTVDPDAETENKYWFTMPSTNVTVTVTFKNNTHSVTVNKTGNGTAAAAGRSSNSSAVMPGDTVDIRILPDIVGKYQFESVTAKTASGADIELKDEKAGKGLTDGYDTIMGDTSYNYRYSFTMPAEDVTVEVKFKDTSEWYNNDGSLKSGVYTAKFEFGKRAFADGSVGAAMGYPAVDHPVQFTVRDDGTIHIDSYKNAGLISPMGFFGFGDTKISKNQPTVASIEAPSFNGGEGGKVNDTDYPVTVKKEDVKTWYTNPYQPGRSDMMNKYTGSEVYRVPIKGSQEDGYWFMSVNPDPAPSYSDTGNTDILFMDDFSFELPASVGLKNTDNVGERTLYMATFPVYMGYYTQMVSVMHFETLDRIGDYIPEGEEKSAIPKFNPNGGEFEESVSVEITAADGAKIYYTTDGTEPTENSTVYDEPLNIAETTTVKAIAVEEGKAPSTAVEVTFTKKDNSGGGSEQRVPDGEYQVPVTIYQANNHERFSMANDAVDGLATVRVSGNSVGYYVSFKGKTIGTQLGHLLELWHYAADDTARANPITAAISKTYEDKGLDGNTATFPKTFTILRNGDAEDSFYIQVKVDAMSTVNNQGETVYSLEDAFMVFDWSGIIEEQEKSAAPTITPNGGEFESTQEVTITAANGADIYYTIDGTNPTENSTKYENAINLTETTTVKAIAVEENKTASDIASATFTKSSSSGGGGGTQSFFLADGRYLVDVALWNEYKDQASMGNAAFDSNKQALVTVRGGKVTRVEIATNPVDVGEYHSAITDMSSADTSISVLERGDLTTKPANKTYQYIKRASFTLPGDAQPARSSDVTYMPVHFTVPDTPMDEIYEDGLDARLRFNWRTAEATDETSIDASSQSGSGTTSGGAGTSRPKSFTLTDDETGIRLGANSETLNQKAKLNVTEVTFGADYDAAKAAAGDLTGKKVYKITATVSGREVEPEGQVTISIPTDGKGLSVARVNGKNAVAIGGEVKNGYYVFGTNDLGLFVVGGNVTDKPAAPAFTDIAGHWAESNINKTAEKGLMNGVGDGKFDPDSTTTRAMIVTILYRLEGEPKVSGKAGFDDVPAGTWYSDAVAWAEANDIVNGYDAKTFGPTDSITREQFATILHRYARFKGMDVSRTNDLGAYTDASEIGDWALDAMRWANAEELITGRTATTLVPRGGCTRAEAATILNRFTELNSK